MFFRILFKNAAIYGFSNVVYQAIPFLALPLLTRYLSPQEYGLVAMFHLGVAVLFPLVGFGSAGTVTIKYAHLEHAALGQFIGAAQIVSLMSACLLITSFVVFGDFAVKISFLPIWLLLLIPMLLVFQSTLQMVLSVWQMQQKPWHNLWSKTLLSLIDIGISLHLIVVVGSTWIGRIIGISSGILVGGIIGLVALIKARLISYRDLQKRIKMVIELGTPLIFYELSFLLVLWTDRIFLARLTGLESAGIYMAAAQIGLALTIIHNSLIRAAVPILFEKFGSYDRQNDKLVTRTIYITDLLFIGSAFLIWFVSENLAHLIYGPEFLDASKIIIWIVIGSAFLGMYKTRASYLFYGSKTVLLGTIGVVGLVMNCILNYFFILKEGPIGAAKATMITYFTIMIATWIFANISRGQLLSGVHVDAT